MRTRWTMAFLLSICLLLPEAFSCGPDFPVAIFVRKTMPDTPLTRFAGGELGLVQPSWSPSYLIVAYRYLSGAPLSLAEQKDAVENWNKQNSQDVGNAIVAQNSAVQEWEKARHLVPNVSASTITNQEAAFGWATFTNCTDGAFINAAETLQDRIRTLGTASPWIRNWVEAQDAVFSNCGEKAPLLLPQPASNAAPVIIAADRQYQTAAAYFYGGKFDDAANGFRRIASNASSPWHQLAPYLVARTLIRESTMSAGSEQDCASKGYCGFDPTTMSQAEQQLRAILADPSLASEHRAARLLLDLVRARLQPMEYAEELSRRVSYTDQDFGHDASDLVWMIHKLASQEGYGVLVFPVSGKQGDPAVAAGQKTAQLMQASDLGDWLVTFPPTGGAATTAADVRAHALEKWHFTHSAAWLICAMLQPGLSEDEQKELLAAARSISPESPAFATVAYLRTALLKTNHDLEDARNVVSAALSPKTSLPISAVNALKSEQIGLARSLDEFLQLAQQDPAVIGDDMTGNVELPFNFGPTKSDYSQIAFSEQAAVTLNRMMPLTALSEAVESNELAPNLRRDLALSAWVRAALLPEGKEISVQLARIIPEMEPSLKEPMEAYLHSASEAADERSFAAVYTILQFPGLRP